MAADQGLGVSLRQPASILAAAEPWALGLEPGRRPTASDFEDVAFEPGGELFDFKLEFREGCAEGFGVPSPPGPRSDLLAARTRGCP
jgi:hypothetical protein